MTKRILIGMGIGFCLVASSQAVYAFNCWDMPDALMCDDFDRYCSPPPGDQMVCSDTATPNGSAMKAVWVRTSHGGAGNELCGGSVEMVPPNDPLKAGITSPPYAVREYSGGDENGMYGQHTVNLVSRIANKWGAQYGAVAGTDGNPLVLRFQIGGGIQNNFAAPFDPAYMEISFDDFTSAGDPYDSNHRAPMDYIWVGRDDGAGCISCRNLCDFLGFPNTGRPGQLVTACRAYEARGWTYDFDTEQRTAVPDIEDSCPPLNSKIYTTLAVGFNAWLDPDPCHCSGQLWEYNFDDPEVGMMPRITQNWHLSYFDGYAWRALKTAGTDPTKPGTFVVGRKTNLVTMWVKSTTVDIQLYTKQSPENQTGVGENGIPIYEAMTSYITGLPRKYQQGFNMLRMGTGTGCQVHNDNYACDGNVHCTRNKIEHCGLDCNVLEPDTCKPGAPTNCCNVDTLANNIVYDDVMLSGGSPWSVEGACCKPDMNCEMLKSGDCAAVSGHWTASGQQCENTLCCPASYGDDNLDGSTDMTDFAALQRCLTVGVVGGQATGSCLCFDADGDNKVGSTADIEQFVDCAMGPGVAGACPGKGW